MCLYPMSRSPPVCVFVSVCVSDTDESVTQTHIVHNTRICVMSLHVPHPMSLSLLVCVCARVCASVSVSVSVC